MSGLYTGGGDTGSRGRRGSANPLFGVARDLGIGEVRGVPLALLRRDSREGTVEMFVVDADAWHERDMVARMPPVGERAAVVPNRDRAGGSVNRSSFSAREATPISWEGERAAGFQKKKLTRCESRCDRSWASARGGGACPSSSWGARSRT
jgi:hypothetical protein